MGADCIVMVEERHHVRSMKGTRKSTELQWPGFISGNGEVATGSMGDEQAWEVLEAQACWSSSGKY